LLPACADCDVPSAATAAKQRAANSLHEISYRACFKPQLPGSYFLKDSKTGACWLVIRSRDDINAALATAPRESCQW
jgi:hypothetical protein